MQKKENKAKAAAATSTPEELPDGSEEKTLKSSNEEKQIFQERILTKMSRFLVNNRCQKSRLEITYFKELGDVAVSRVLDSAKHPPSERISLLKMSTTRNHLLPTVLH